jgi:5-methylcytosine-specific restriction endonuclease McrA
MAATSSVSASAKARIKVRDNYLCKVCGVSAVDGVVARIISAANGGTSDDSNLQLMCSECNRLKRAKDSGNRVKTGVDDNGMPTDPGHHWNT